MIIIKYRLLIKMILSHLLFGIKFKKKLINKIIRQVKRTEKPKKNYKATELYAVKGYNDYHKLHSQDI